MTKKGITIIKKDSIDVSVFEGFFDFLAALDMVKTGQMSSKII